MSLSQSRAHTHWDTLTLYKNILTVCRLILVVFVIVFGASLEPFKRKSAAQTNYRILCLTWWSSVSLFVPPGKHWIEKIREKTHVVTTRFFFVCCFFRALTYSTISGVLFVHRILKWLVVLLFSRNPIKKKEKKTKKKTIANFSPCSVF